MFVTWSMEVLLSLSIETKRYITQDRLQWQMFFDPRSRFEQQQLATARPSCRLGVVRHIAFSAAGAIIRHALVVFALHSFLILKTALWRRYRRFSDHRTWFPRFPEDSPHLRRLSHGQARRVRREGDRGPTARESAGNALPERQVGGE